MFRSEEFSLLGKSVVMIFVLLLISSALWNLYRGLVISPALFSISLLGLLCFLTAKLSIIVKGPRISFGSSTMSGKMANLYRLGYWLMFVGVVLTFAG